METAQIDQATNRVFATCRPPVTGTPAPQGVYFVDYDETKEGSHLGKTYDPVAKTFSAQGA